MDMILTNVPSLTVIEKSTKTDFDRRRQNASIRCLWLAREMPYPVISGDRSYSGQLAASFAQAGVDLHFVGLASTDDARAPAEWPIRWIPIAGTRKHYAIALFSRHPFVTAAHATSRHRRTLTALLKQRWDTIVLDNYGSGWALEAVCRSAQSAEHRPVLVHIAHNHEESLSQSLFHAYRGSPLKRLALYQNHLKIRYLERALVHKADIVTVITEADRRTFSRLASDQQFLVLPPGFSGWVAPQRVIAADSPKHVVLIGSFRWVVKMENLRRVVRIMDPVFHQHGITLDVVGEVPDQLLDELRPIARATRFHGFVDDVAPYLQSARMALVPEVIGGGFKLKLLDYIFGRVPVATITEAAAGLSAEIQANMFCEQTLEDLAREVVANINNFTLLNRMQEHAFEAAASQFDWHDRGRDLKRAIRSVVEARAGLPANAAVPLQSGSRT